VAHTVKRWPRAQRQEDHDGRRSPHDLGAFAAARWTDRSAPFFAEPKVMRDVISCACIASRRPTSAVCCVAATRSDMADVCILPWRVSNRRFA
jgi:hypothetical protein